MIDFAKHFGDPNPNLLIIGSGPSVFYNMRRLKKYINSVKPIIIGINGYLHGIRYLAGKRYHETMPNGEMGKVSVGEIRSLIPHVMISFCKRNDGYTSNGEQKKGRERKDADTDLFRHFIENHKRVITKNNIALMCPTQRTGKHVKHKHGRANQWGYENYFEFDLFPAKYTKATWKKFQLKDVEKLEPAALYDKGRIQFRPRHGGEYVLSWASSLNPKTIATCGLCDNPNETNHILLRGWFWLPRRRIMPKHMNTNQSRILDMFRRKWGDRYTNLNWSSR